jgi:hypothetical protein
VSTLKQKIPALFITADGWWKTRDFRRLFLVSVSVVIFIYHAAANFDIFNKNIKKMLKFFLFTN